jgi:hypothetical protein
MALKDKIKLELTAAELAAHNTVVGFFAKVFTGKTLAIVAVVAFVLGVLAHKL